MSDLGMRIPAILERGETIVPRQKPEDAAAYLTHFEELAGQALDDFGKTLASEQMRQLVKRGGE